MTSAVIPVDPDKLSCETAETFLEYLQSYPVLFNKQLDDYSGIERQNALRDIAMQMKENGLFL